MAEGYNPRSRFRWEFFILGLYLLYRRQTTMQVFASSNLGYIL